MRDANDLPNNPRLTIKEEDYPDRHLTVEFAQGTRDGNRTILLISCLEGPSIELSLGADHVEALLQELTPDES